MRHEPIKDTLTVASAAVSTGALAVDKYREKTVAFKSSGTWTSTTVRVLGQIGASGYLPVGYVSGSGAKTLTAAGMILVPEAVDDIKIEATVYDAASGTITAYVAGFNARTE